MIRIHHLAAANNYYIILFFKKAPSLLLAIMSILIMETNSMASNKEYSVKRRSDGGYTIDITINKRHWKPITAEGFFPKQRMHFVVEVIGQGQDWSKIDQKGFFYSSEYVMSKGKAWDFGYAWIDFERKFLYLNFYWVASPDSIIPSDVNGTYNLAQ